MAIPSAAGFIPNQSIVSDLINLYNTFGQSGKDKRNAETERLRAETAHIKNEDAYRGDVSAINWAKYGQDQQAQDDKSGQFWQGLLPIHQGQQEVDQARQGEVARHNKVEEGLIQDQGNRSWYDSMNRGQLDAAQAGALERNSDPKKQAQDLIGQLLTNPTFVSMLPEGVVKALKMGTLTQLTGESENPAGGALQNEMHRQQDELARIQQEQQMKARGSSGGIMDFLTSLTPLRTIQELHNGGIGLDQLFNLSQQGQQGPTPAPQRQSTPAPSTPVQQPPPYQGRTHIPTTLKQAVQNPHEIVEPPLPQKDDPTAQVWDMINPSNLQGGGPTSGPGAVAGGGGTFTPPPSPNQYRLPDWLMQLISPQQQQQQFSQQ